ncbi:hypothetical protein GOODEAATRI_029413, partial [Goodea atripinnis]
NAMQTMQFTEENISEILRLLAGILHAGNIEFMTAGGAQVASKSGWKIYPSQMVDFIFFLPASDSPCRNNRYCSTSYCDTDCFTLCWTSELLGLNSDQLAEVLTHRSMILRGEEISTPLTVEQVRR